MRMVNVKHQAALLWALRKIKAMKGKNVEERKEKEMRKYIKAVQILMKDGVTNRHVAPREIKDNQQAIQELMKHFAGWRDHLGITQGFDEETKDIAEKKNQIIINYPVFQDGDLSSENDLYMVQGFFKPGCHRIIIYDPERDCFFKRENILVSPRQVDVKCLKQELSPVRRTSPLQAEPVDMTKAYYE